jgi:hypothetical protein
VFLKIIYSGKLDLLQAAYFFKPIKNAITDSQAKIFECFSSYHFQLNQKLLDTTGV